MSSDSVPASVRSYARVYLAVQPDGQAWAVSWGTSDMPEGALWGSMRGTDGAGIRFDLQSFLGDAQGPATASAAVTTAGAMTLSAPLLSAQFQRVQSPDATASQSDLPRGIYTVYVTRDDFTHDVFDVAIDADGRISAGNPTDDACGLGGSVRPATTGSKLFSWTLTNRQPAGSDCGALRGGERLEGMLYLLRGSAGEVRRGLGFAQAPAHAFAIAIAPQ